MRKAYRRMTVDGISCCPPDHHQRAHDATQAPGANPSALVDPHRAMDSSQRKQEPDGNKHRPTIPTNVKAMTIEFCFQRPNGTLDAPDRRTSLRQLRVNTQF
jgi:hypothetical protein